MSMMDLMNQGGAPPDQGAPPPDPYGGGAPGGDPSAMAALLGAAPPDPNAPPPDPGAGGPPPDGGASAATDGDETSDYRDALASLQSALGRATTDEIEKAQISKCISAIQDLLSNNQKAMDTALGTSPQLRKALAGGGA